MTNDEQQIPELNKTKIYSMISSGASIGTTMTVSTGWMP
jgi:hypothetical protein